MKNFNIISDCIQAFLSENEIASILEDIEYKDSARKFNVSNLLNHWVASSVDGWRSFLQLFLRKQKMFLLSFLKEYL